MGNVFAKNRWLTWLVSIVVVTALSNYAGTLLLPQPARAQTGNLILFWDGTGSAPAGWSYLSDLGGDFYQRFPRGAATYGGTGGADSYTHTLNWASASTTTAPANFVAAGPTSYGAGAHTHSTLSTSSMDSGTSLPPYRNLRAIRYDTTGEPATIPSGAIAVFDATFSNADWTLYIVQDTYFVRTDISGQVGGTGGATSHNHLNVSATTGGPSATVGDGSATAAAIPTDTHGHSWSGQTSSTSNHLPLYVQVLLYQTIANTAPLTGMIGMWNNTPPSSWATVSGGGQAFNSRFLRADSTYSEGLGSATHTHNNISATTGTGTPTAQPSSSNKKDPNTAAHTHTLEVSFAAQDNLPSYIDAIFAKKDNISLDVTSPPVVTLNSGNPGTTTSPYTFSTLQYVTVTSNGYTTWDLSAQITTAPPEIPAANYKLGANGVMEDPGATPTYVDSPPSGVSEATFGGDFYLGLDSSRVFISYSGASSSVTANVRPTMKVVIPPSAAPGDYNANLRLTVV